MANSTNQPTDQPTDRVNIGKSALEYGMTRVHKCTEMFTNQFSQARGFIHKLG